MYVRIIKQASLSFCLVGRSERGTCAFAAFVNGTQVCGGGFPYLVTIQIAGFASKVKALAFRQLPSTFKFFQGLLCACVQTA